MAQTAIHARMTAAEWALLVGLSVLWGGSFLFVGVAVAELPPLTIVVARVALAAAALLVALRFMGVALPRERRGLGGLLRPGGPHHTPPLPPPPPGPGRPPPGGAPGPP